VFVQKWPFLPWTAFSVGIDPQRSLATPAANTLVRACPEKKVLIYESDTLNMCPSNFFQGSWLGTHWSLIQNLAKNSDGY
jgi:hypothetical protein